MPALRIGAIARSTPTPDPESFAPTNPSMPDFVSQWAARIINPGFVPGRVAVTLKKIPVPPGVTSLNSSRSDFTPRDVKRLMSSTKALRAPSVPGTFGPRSTNCFTSR